MISKYVVGIHCNAALSVSVLIFVLVMSLYFAILFFQHSDVAETPRIIFDNEHDNDEELDESFNVWLICTAGFNSSYLLIPYFVEWYQRIGIKPQHFILNININTKFDDNVKFNKLLNYFNETNITNYNLWRSTFTSRKKQKIEMKLIKKYKIKSTDYILAADIDEFQDWNNFGVNNIYSFISNELIANNYEYVTGYLIDRFSENGKLINPQSPYNSDIDIISSLFAQYPFSCDFTKKIVVGIINKVCLYKNIYLLNGGGRHRINKRLKKYKNNVLRIENKKKNTTKIMGDSILRYKHFQIKIHHFKWSENVINYLKERIIVYKKEKLWWWTQSENAIKWLLENERNERNNINLKNIQQFNCQRIEDKNIHILLCCDEKDRFPMYTLINSIIINEKQNISRLKFHILVLKNIKLFKQEIIKYFEQYLNKITFQFVSIHNEIDNEIDNECMKYIKMASKYIDSKHRLNEMMNFARFCLPNIFKNVSIGIYIDVDMIVKQSISKLYDEYYYKNDYVAWSVLNREYMIKIRAPKTTNYTSFNDSFYDRNKIEFINNYLNNNLNAKYPSISSKPIDFQHIYKFFNAGILMFNLDIWRKYNFTKQSIELFKFAKIYQEKWSHPPWNGVTQSILNMLFIINNIKIGNFGNEWNFVIKDHLNYECQSKWDDDNNINLQKANNANIIHWAGPCKPWIIPSNAPLTSLWSKYIPKNANITNWKKQLNTTYFLWFQKHVHDL